MTPNPTLEAYLPNDSNQPHSKTTNKVIPEMMGTEHITPPSGEKDTNSKVSKDSEKDSNQFPSGEMEERIAEIDAITKDKPVEDDNYAYLYGRDCSWLLNQLRTLQSEHKRMKETVSDHFQYLPRGMRLDHVHALLSSITL